MGDPASLAIVTVALALVVAALAVLWALRLRRREAEHRGRVRADAASGDVPAVPSYAPREPGTTLIEENALLRAGAELRSDWVLAVDPDGNVVLANDALRAWTGTADDDVRDRSLTDLLGAGPADAFLAVAAGVLENGHPAVFTQRVVREDRGADAVWTVGPHRVDGRVPGVVAVARLRAADGEHQPTFARGDHVPPLPAAPLLGPAELHDRRQQDVDTFKDEVLALISHDLRTPLTSILGYTDLLLGERSGLDARHERFVRVIARNGERLMELVDDLLVVAQHQAGALTVSPSQICVEAAVAQSVAAAHPATSAKSIVVSIDVTDRLTVMADPVRLGQVLDNLVTNAVNYTPEGGNITVSAEPMGDRVRFQVRDNGPGIPDEEQERIFQRFTRARHAAVGGVKGFGLGLPISHAIVTAHGGEMGVESALGVGSTFWFTLPLGGRMEGGDA